MRGGEDGTGTTEYAGALAIVAVIVAAVALSGAVPQRPLR